MESAADVYSVSPFIIMETGTVIGNCDGMESIPSYQQTCTSPSALDVPTENDPMLYLAYTPDDFLSDQVYMPDGHNDSEMADPDTMATPVALVKNAVITDNDDGDIKPLQTGDSLLDDANSQTVPEVESTVLNQTPSSHSCSVCNKVFTTPQGLYGHSRTHRTKSPKKYVKKRHASYSYRLSPSQIKVDMASDQNNLPQMFACKLCGKEFALERNLKQHDYAKHKRKQIKRFMLNAPSKKPFSSFSRSVAAASTLVSKSAYRNRFSCRHCGGVFTTQGNLNRHELSHCTNPQKYSCPYCPALLCQSQSVKRHVQFVHPGLAVPRMGDLNVITPARSPSVADIEQGSVVNSSKPEARKADGTYQNVSGRKSTLATDKKSNAQPIPEVLESVQLCATNSVSSSSSNNLKSTSLNAGQKISDSYKYRNKLSPRSQVQRNTGKKQRKLEANSFASHQLQESFVSSNIASGPVGLNISRSTHIPSDQQVPQNVPKTTASGSVVEVIQEMVTRVVIRFPDGSTRNEVYRRVL